MLACFILYTGMALVLADMRSENKKARQLTTEHEILLQTNEKFTSKLLGKAVNPRDLNVLKMLLVLLEHLVHVLKRKHRVLVGQQRVVVHRERVRTPKHDLHLGFPEDRSWARLSTSWSAASESRMSLVCSRAVR